MRFLALRAIAIAVVAGVMCAVAAPAAAEETGRIFNQAVDNSSRTISFNFSATDQSLAVDPATVKTTVDGRALGPKVSGVADQPQQDLTAVLVIDTSGSMAGNKIVGARNAARAFLDAVPDEVKVGLVTFDKTPDIVAEPTTDHAAVRRSVDDLTAGGTTALFDAVTTASKWQVRRACVASCCFPMERTRSARPNSALPYEPCAKPRTFGWTRLG